MKPKKIKIKGRQRFWAGFFDGRIHHTLEYYGNRFPLAAIYIRKMDAEKSYDDVRLVEIKIISQ